MILGFKLGRRSRIDLGKKKKTLRNPRRKTNRTARQTNKAANMTNGGGDDLWGWTTASTTVRRERRSHTRGERGRKKEAKTKIRQMCQFT